MLRGARAAWHYQSSTLEIQRALGICHTPRVYSAHQHRYWPCYCEENVWHLCAEGARPDTRPPRGESGGAQVAFISNPERQVAFWCQRQAPQPYEPTVWDYHVALLGKDAVGDWQVWDLDTALGCPVPAGLYLDLTFPRLEGPGAVYAPLFRLLPADVYRRELRTDRRHMRNSDGHYVNPPPPWPPIGEGSNLMRFVDMEADFLGEVLDREALRRRLGQ